MTADPGSRRSTTGFEPTIAAAIAYALGAISGLIILSVERENRFVRFHAIQSIVFSIGVMVIVLLVGALPVFSHLLSWVARVGAVVVWVVLIWQALMGRWFRLPYVGDAIDDHLP